MVTEGHVTRHSRCCRRPDVEGVAFEGVAFGGRGRERSWRRARLQGEQLAAGRLSPPPQSASACVPSVGRAPMPGPTQTLSPNGENNNDIIQDNGTIIPFRKHTVRGERSYRYWHGRLRTVCPVT